MACVSRHYRLEPLHPAEEREFAVAVEKGAESIREEGVLVEDQGREFAAQLAPPLKGEGAEWAGLDSAVGERDQGWEPASSP